MTSYGLTATYDVTETPEITYTVANRSASSTSNGENNTSSDTTCTCYEACGCDLTDRQKGISADGNYCSPSKKLSAPCNCDTACTGTSSKLSSTSSTGSSSGTKTSSSGGASSKQMKSAS